MKKQLKTLALVSLLVLGNQTFANEGDSAKIEVKSNKEVVNILSKKGKKIVKKNGKDLELYISVMDLYNTAPASFYNLDENTKNNFFAAAENLNDSFSDSRRKEVKELAAQVGFNAAVSKFIWDVKEDNKNVVSVLETPKPQNL